jgi:type VI secretion system secreted protein Hcp
MAMAFLKYGKIKGSVTAAGYKEWIEIESVSFGIGRGISTTTGADTNREAGTPSVSEIVVSKKLDAASSYLMQDALHGEGVVAKIHLVHSDKDKIQPYNEFELENCLLSGWSYSYAGERPSETVSINFTKITFTQHELNEKNESKAKHHAIWNAKLGASKK